MSTKPIEETVGEFHLAVDDLPFICRDDEGRAAGLDLRLKLITEEYRELIDELLDLRNGQGDVQKIAKEMADLVYVIAGSAFVMEIPLGRVFDEVHASNMSKIPADGVVVRRADGKILKPDTYREPDLSFLGA